MFDRVSFATVDLETSQESYRTIFATLGINPLTDINTERGIEGIGCGRLISERFRISTCRRRIAEDPR